MKQSVDDRAAMLGEYIVQNKATVRRAAKQFGVSKSTVHKDVAERLPQSCVFQTGLSVHSRCASHAMRCGNASMRTAS